MNLEFYTTKEQKSQRTQVTEKRWGPGTRNSFGSSKIEFHNTIGENTRETQFRNEGW